MSSVYQAEEIETGRTVAVKVLSTRLLEDEASVHRMRREAGVTSSFDHPNVCPTLQFGQSEDGHFYLVMPFLAGETLSDYEVRQRRIPIEEGVDILMQVCQGLQYAHDHGSVHRDLKPENVMLVAEGIEGRTRCAVVMDFGLAQERRQGKGALRLTATGIVLGTPEFMSPEQIRGRELDGRSDIYALGVVAFELFTGELPFHGVDAQETMVARLRGEPRSMRAIRPDVPARLEAVIRKAMALAPVDRWQSMTEFAQGLDSVTNSFFRRMLKKLSSA